MPLVSVIIPVHNGDRTIAETIQSVLQQTLTDFELIVVNSGSSDRTPEILSHIHDARMRVLTLPKANVAVNRNLGFQASSSPFVTFLDADDQWTPDKLEAQYQILHDNPWADVAYSWTACVDEAGRFLRRCSDVTWQGNVLPALLLDDFIGSGSNVMIRRQAMEQSGGFDESLTNAQDTDLWLRLALHHQFIGVPKPQILYQVSPQSMSSNLLGLERSNLSIIESSFRQAPEQLQGLKPVAIANLYKYLLYRALDSTTGREFPWITARYLRWAIKTDPALLKTPVIYKAILKWLLLVTIPSPYSSSLLKRFPRLSNTSTLLGYEKLYQEGL